MKKRYLILGLASFLCFNLEAQAKQILKDEVPNATYIIGKHTFDRNTNDVYNGQLTTQYIMLASKTIEGNHLDDMIIYYKNPRGNWINGLTGESIEVPDEFNITTTDGIKNKYTITFNTDGGNTIENILVEDGQKITVSNPTKEHYTFDKWVLEDNTKFDMNTEVTRDMTLKAVYVANTYAIGFTNEYFGSGGADLPYNSTLTFTQENDVEGYKFAYWVNANDESEKHYADEEYTVVGSVIFKAVYEMKNYTIKIVGNVDEYSPDVELKVYEEGNEITIKELKYADGTTIANGNNLVVNKNDIENITNFKIILNGDTEVDATLEETN